MHTHKLSDTHTQTHTHSYLYTYTYISVMLHRVSFVLTSYLIYSSTAKIMDLLTYVACNIYKRVLANI